MRKTPEKGNPDFSMFNAKEVVDMRLCLNKLMGCYAFSKEKKSLLEEMWKELAFASVEAVAAMPEKEEKVSARISRNNLFRKNLLKKKSKST